MPLYYNKSGGSLAVTLKSGRTASLPGKTWSSIDVEDEGSEDLIRVLGAGFLTRFDAGEENSATPESAPPAETKASEKPADEHPAEKSSKAAGPSDHKPTPAEKPAADEHKAVGAVPLPFKPETTSVAPGPVRAADDTGDTSDNSRRRKV